MSFNCLLGYWCLRTNCWFKNESWTSDAVTRMRWTSLTRSGCGIVCADCVFVCTCNLYPPQASMCKSLPLHQCTSVGDHKQTSKRHRYLHTWRKMKKKKKCWSFTSSTDLTSVRIFLWPDLPSIICLRIWKSKRKALVWEGVLIHRNEFN